MIISNLLLLKKAAVLHLHYETNAMVLNCWFVTQNVLQVSYGSQRAANYNTTNYRSVAKAGSHQEQ